jgi:hypothetical protein
VKKQLELLTESISLSLKWQMILIVQQEQVLFKDKDLHRKVIHN